MTSRLITGTGWTIRELDETPYPVVADLQDYWALNPPVHELVKAFLSEEEDDIDEDLDRTPFTFEEMKRMAGQ